MKHRPSFENLGGDVMGFPVAELNPTENRTGHLGKTSDHGHVAGIATVDPNGPSTM